MTAFVTGRFRRCIDKLLTLEGGYVNHKSDKGGETKFGISKRAYPTVNIAALTRDDATQIYHKDYWSPLHLDEFASEELASAVFDMGVNAGIGRAAKLLQTAVNNLGKPLSVDGHIGRATVAMVNNFPEELLLDEFKTECCRHYDRIVANDPTQAVFLKGWKRRIYGSEEA